MGRGGVTTIPYPLMASLSPHNPSLVWKNQVHAPLMARVTLVSCPRRASLAPHD